ncbi:MAG: GyrI-like domain-containing protein [Flavicella sp.]
MQPRIELLKEKTLVGISKKTSISDNKTGILWSHFSPRIKEISQRVKEKKISLQIYPPNYFKNFNPHNAFEKWAAVEVFTSENIPKEMQTLKLKEGLYAVFDYKGSSADTTIYQYIFSTWLPNSIYTLDDRPHFEVLGVNYKNNDSNSEEEIWIPIKKIRVTS